MWPNWNFLMVNMSSVVGTRYGHCPCRYYEHRWGLDHRPTSKLTSLPLGSALSSQHYSIKVDDAPICLSITQSLPLRVMLIQTTWYDTTVKEKMYEAVREYLMCKIYWCFASLVSLFFFLDGGWDVRACLSKKVCFEPLMWCSYGCFWLLFTLIM